MDHNEELRQRYLNVDTANVADVLDSLGRRDQGLSPGFFALETDTKLAGWAYTIRGQHTPFPGGGDPAKMEALDGLTAGSIAVWSGGSAQGVCLFGELLAKGMQSHGCAGAVVDGGVRDTKWIRALHFPVFARYTTPIQSTGRWKVNAWQLPVYLPGATSAWVEIAPGDFLLADGDGIMVIPAALVEQVLPRVEDLTRREEDIRRATGTGTTLTELLNKYGHV